MLTSLGHEVFLYGGTENEANVKEFITVVSDEDRQRWFGHYDWDTMVFSDWDNNAECWRSMNSRAAGEIEKRKQPGDFVGLISGACQKQIADLHPDLQSVEWGVGYEGVIHNGFRVFESYAWMHYIYGKQNVADGRFFDTVIPNAFDPDDYVFKSQKDDYLLYLGRLTERKGMEILRELVKRGHRVVTAGQGDLRIAGAEYVGVVRGVAKAELLANAKALLVPTIYIEPFGGVAIEAMMSGTPVITNDFGAFTETVVSGINGYRCSTMLDYEEAVSVVKYLDHEEIKFHSDDYSTDVIRYQYEKYFKRLQLLSGAGWYS